MATYFVAQVMTRGMVKSKLMYERKWVIRSQVPVYFFLECSSSTKCWLAFTFGISLRYSQTSFERMQNDDTLNLAIFPNLGLMRQGKGDSSTR